MQHAGVHVIHFKSQHFCFSRSYDPIRRDKSLGADFRPREVSGNGGVAGVAAVEEAGAVGLHEHKVVATGVGLRDREIIVVFWGGAGAGAGNEIAL